MKIIITLNDKEIDWEKMSSEEKRRLADELNMQGLVQLGYRVKHNSSQQPA